MIHFNLFRTVMSCYKLSWSEFFFYFVKRAITIFKSMKTLHLPQKTKTMSVPVTDFARPGSSRDERHKYEIGCRNDRTYGHTSCKRRCRSCPNKSDTLRRQIPKSRISMNPAFFAWGLGFFFKLRPFSCDVMSIRFQGDFLIKREWSGWNQRNELCGSLNTGPEK